MRGGRGGMRGMPGMGGMPGMAGRGGHGHGHGGHDEDEGPQEIQLPIKLSDLYKGGTKTFKVTRNIVDASGKQVCARARVRFACIF